MHNRNLTLESRRTSRVSKLLPVRIRTRDTSGGADVFGAWTVVVNRHGARFESKRPFESSGAVEVTVLATGRSAPGRVIWTNPRSNFRDNFEFAIELVEPANMWGITFPPEDWNESEASASEHRSEGIQAVPAPLKPLNPKESKETVTVLDSASKAMSAGVGGSSKDVTEVLGPVPVASNVTAISGGNENALTRTSNAVERAESGRVSGSAMTDRLTMIVREFIESAVQIEEEAATNRLIATMRDQFDQAKQSAFSSFEEKTTAVVVSSAACLEERAAEIDAQSKKIVNDGLSMLGEAQERGAKAIRDEADASFSVIASLRNDVGQFAKTTEEQFAEQCRQQTEKVLADSLEAAHSRFTEKMEELAGKISKRTESILAETMSAMESRANAAIAEAASRLEMQRNEFGKNLDEVAGKLLTDISEKQKVAAEKAHTDFKSAAEESMGDLRAGLTRMLRGVADAVAVLEGDRK